jgi:peptidoglycan/LPS O-acetylase OafA/YrhL
VIALQLYLLLPFLVSLIRKRPAFWQVLLTTMIVTLSVYGFNRYLYRLPSTSNIVFWYTPTIALGLWLASQSNRLDEIVKRGTFAAGVTALIGWLVYLPLALQAMLGQPVNTFIYQTANWLYTAGISFVLLVVAIRLNERWQGQPRLQILAFLGRHSLQIYLIHPIVLRELEQLPGLRENLGFLLAFAIDSVLAVLIPLGFARLAARMNVSVWVFGR